MPGVYCRHVKAREPDGRQNGDVQPGSGIPGPRVPGPIPKDGRPAPSHVAVLALQRSAGNHAVARQFAGPLPPGSPMHPLMHLFDKTPLERVQEKLEYGVIDWAVTDEDAADAARILSDMSDADLTSAVATLDASGTPYLDRLVDNATLATVRTPGFAKVMRKRAPARNKVLAEALVSYGFLDWEITPPEAEAAQTLLDALSESDRDKLSEDWMRRRIQENIALPGDYEQGVGEQL